METRDMTNAVDRVKSKVRLDEEQRTEGWSEATAVCHPPPL